MSLGLFIDTSLRGLQVGIFANVAGSESSGEILWQHVVPDNPGSSGQIGAIVSNGLRDCQKSARDVSHILVASGPGSFTGIKIGLAFVYGFVRGLPRPVVCYGLSSIELIARRLANVAGQPVQLVLPATQAQGFLCSSDGVSAQTRVVALSQSVVENGFAAMPVELIEPWPALSGYLDRSGLSGRLISPEHWRVVLFEAALAEYAALAAQTGMSPDVLPQANFMRYAAPVERQMQNKTSLGEIKI